ncbi:hypothetical protein LOTGIDRAFT_158452 [Lottia gigantea]|uniref:Uncharacterized protein n=1 Tax=Lottia gigantea TaxID=225164 RepID=V4AWJ3_LOTGI|nr:hypothetical protein LOTGIDRAFT_158452 [Lottia gigantea]ESO99365.1 hypothetical protein LOTGIDRAFT_158452 [Lottia gigantea]
MAFPFFSWRLLSSQYQENEMFSPISPATSPPVYRAVSNRQQHVQGDGPHHQRQHHRQPEHEQNQQHHQSRATRPQAFQTSHPHSHSHLENHVVPNHLIALSPSHSSPQLTAGSGYQPSNVYTTKTSYRSQMYPTLTNRSQSSSSNQSEYDNMRSGGRLEGSLDSGFSSANNMYNITSQQKSHYDSTDRLKSPVHGTYDKTLTTKHGSLEGAYRKKTNKSGNSYGSLERNRNKKKDYSNNSGHYNDPRSHYGGKRESGSEYSDPETPTPNTSHCVEVPVHHETDESHYYTTKQFLYGDSFTSQDLSPLPPTSPRKEYTDHVLREHVNEQSYSPRTYESSYSRSERRAYSPTYEHNVSSSSINVKRIESQPSASKLVTVKQFQPHTEVSKPYELSDFYKYSERLRRQRQVDVYQKQLIGVDRLSRCSTPSQSSDGDYASNTSQTSQPGSPYRSTTHANYRGDYQQAYSPGPASPDISTSTTYHSVKAPGIQYATKTVYKSQHIESGAPKHSTYQAPRPMTCQPVKNMYSTSASPSPVSSRQDKDVTSLPSSESTSSFTAPQSLVDGFSDEVLAWLDDQNTPQPPTLV